MTGLDDILARRIAATGPISVAEFMAECLLHPDHGYYATREPFGTAGDFVTAPEISQMFGELLGLALAQSWLDQGSPDPFTLAELGPGRGTLMADVLRTTAQVRGFHEAAQVVLVEASARLRLVQQETLKHEGAVWANSAADLPSQPLFLIANEFFDALPVRQFQRDDTGWRERQIGLEEGRLVFGLSEPVDMPELSPRTEETATGQVVEICPQAGPIIQEIAARIASFGGMAMIVDYGDWNGTGDTFQALHGGAPSDPLVHPGAADLTAHVDFAALARAATGVSVTPMTDQAVLLGRLGIAQRAAKLAENLTGDALASHLAGYRRLTDGAEMGTLFKTIALYPRGGPLPPGYDPDPEPVPADI